jgi:hypothetical protein
MKKLAFVIMILAAATCAFGQTEINTQNTDNPGYFRSPGFVAISAGYVYHGGNTTNEKAIRPHVLGMINLLQSEYGNLALSLGAMYSTPESEYDTGSVRYDISAKQYSGEIGLNYLTGSNSVNFWLGGGYSYNYVTADAKSFRNASDVSANYNKSFTDTTGGFFLHVGIEYILTKDGNLGMFFQYRYTDADRAQFDIDTNLDFGGSPQALKNQSSLTTSNQLFFFGVTYHF